MIVVLTSLIVWVVVTTSTTVGKDSSSPTQKQKTKRVIISASVLAVAIGIFVAFGGWIMNWRESNYRSAEQNILQKYDVSHADFTFRNSDGRYVASSPSSKDNGLVQITTKDADVVEVYYRLGENNEPLLSNYAVSGSKQIDVKTLEKK